MSTCAAVMLHRVLYNLCSGVAAGACALGSLAHARVVEALSTVIL